MLDENEKKRLEKCIQKKDLIHGCYYLGDCRNASIARWNSDLQKFYYNRHKFGDTFVESIRHPEDDDGHDLFWPDCLLTDYEIPESHEEKIFTSGL